MPRKVGCILLVTVFLASAAHASPPDGYRSSDCPVDTTTYSDTGRDNKGIGVFACRAKDEKKSPEPSSEKGSVGLSIPGKEVQNFVTKPFGSSDKSVVKMASKEVSHFVKYPFGKKKHRH